MHVCDNLNNCVRADTKVINSQVSDIIAHVTCSILSIKGMFHKQLSFKILRPIYKLYLCFQLVFSPKNESKFRYIKQLFTYFHFHWIRFRQKELSDRSSRVANSRDKKRKQFAENKRKKKSDLIFEKYNLFIAKMTFEYKNKATKKIKQQIIFRKQAINKQPAKARERG